jgi:hypothetical protein
MGSGELEPELDDSPNDLLTRRLLRAESDAAIWREQYNLLFSDYMLILSGADAVLKSIGDPLILEEIYTIVDDNDPNLAKFFRPLVDMMTEFNFNFQEVTESGMDI